MCFTALFQLPEVLFLNDVEIECLDVLGSTLGKENCFGACKGHVAAGDMTFIRLTTDDQRGTVKAYLGEGVFRDEVIPTKGGVANCYIENCRICCAMFAKMDMNIMFALSAAM